MKQLLRTPVISAVCIGTLALATGATTAIFALVYGVLLRPLPYRDVSALVELHTVREQGAGTPAGFSLAEFEDWRSRARTIGGLAAFATDEFSLAVPGDTAASIHGAIVSSGFFDLIGTAPTIGRYLNADRADEPEVVISDRLWRALFGASPRITGETIQLNGRAFAVAGVADPLMRLPADDIDVWMPLNVARQTAPPQWSMRGYRIFSLAGRLNAGSDLAAARDEARAIAADWQRTYPRFSSGQTATVTLLRDQLLGPVRPALWLLLAAAGMVLLVACTNLTSLLLSRNVTRAREFAVRIALGARPIHILRSSLTEAGWLATLGAGGGLLIAAALTRALPALAPAGLPRVADARVDVPVLAFTLAVTVVVTLVLGAVIGVGAWRASTAGALGDARTLADRKTRRLQGGLVVAQIGLSLALVVTASLLTRSLARLMAAPVGVSNVQAVTMKLTAVPAGFLDRALPEIAALPGVEAAGVISNLPPNVSQMHTTVSAVSATTGASIDASVDIVSVSPSAFDALGIRLVRGRTFSDADLTSERRVLVISELTAARLFPGVDPVGRALPFGPQDPSRPPPEIVGVVSNVRYAGLDAPADGALYLPYTARPFAMTHLVVRSSDRDTAALTRAVREVVRRVDAGQALSDIRPLNAVIRASASPSRLRAYLLSSLAGLALLLAVMGLYAVAAHAVGTRTVEIGVRMALGATRGNVRALVMRRGLTLTTVGVAAGLLPAYVASRLASRFLYGVTAMDPVSVTASIAVLVVAAAIAVWVPAVRASRVPPLAALRTQ